MYDELPMTIGRYYEDRALLAFIDSLPEEKPSEDLEEAAEEHIRKVADAAGHPGWDWTTQDIADAFIAGAEWQKKHLRVVLTSEEIKMPYATKIQSKY